jgi:hypothetical protein
MELERERQRGASGTRRAGAEWGHCGSCRGDQIARCPLRARCRRPRHRRELSKRDLTSVRPVERPRHVALERCHPEEHAVRAWLDAGRNNGGAACARITEHAEREHCGQRHPRWLAARSRRHARASGPERVARQDRARRVEEREARWRMVHGIELRGQPRTGQRAGRGARRPRSSSRPRHSRQARGQRAVHAAGRQHARPVRRRGRESGVERVRRHGARVG